MVVITITINPLTGVWKDDDPPPPNGYDGLLLRISPVAVEVVLFVPSGLSHLKKPCMVVGSKLFSFYFGTMVMAVMFFVMEL